MEKNCNFTILYCLFLPKSDIQEFYEATLMDGSKSVTQKTMETLEVASKWEQQTYATPMRPDNSPVSFYVLLYIFSALKRILSTVVSLPIFYSI